MGAVEAAVRAARAQGPRVDEPVVVRDRTNVIVRIDQWPLVGRVPMMLGPFRGREWIVHCCPRARAFRRSGRGEDAARAAWGAAPFAARHGRSASSSGFPQSELVAEARRRVARALEPLTR